MHKDDKDRAIDKNPANRDPLSGAPGAHPVGVGAGAAGGAAAGAAIGAVGGPVGTAVGATVGGVAGGLAGKRAAEAVNPTVEDTYWRSNYSTRPYVEQGVAYATYRAAYQYGWESHSRHRGRRFEEVEGELARGWDKAKAGSKLTWDKAKAAVSDAWHRMERAPAPDRGRR
jgi:phage tail tape-measure protein